MGDRNDDDFVKNDGEEEDSLDVFEIQANQALSAHLKENAKRPASSTKSGRPESSRYNNNNNSKADKKGTGTNSSGTQQDQQQSNDNPADQKHKKVYEALRKQNSQQVLPAVLIRMSKYMAFHHISLKTFWKSSQIFVPLDEFVDYCLQAGFVITESELESLQKELTDIDGYVTIELLCAKIHPWNNQENAMLEFIRGKVLDLVSSSKKKLKLATSQSGLNSRVPTAKVRPQTTSSSNQQLLLQQNTYYIISGGQLRYSIGFFGLIRQSFAIIEDRSRNYLQQYKNKQAQQDKLLNMAISRNQDEIEYETLIKMGEANEIQQELGSINNYRAYKTPVFDSFGKNIKEQLIYSGLRRGMGYLEGHMLVHFYEGDQFRAQFSLIEFRREFTSLKNAYNESKQLKIWEVLSEKKKPITGRDFNKKNNNQKLETAVPSVEQQQQGEGGDQGAGKKQQTTRQKELKKVLLETMWLSNILSEQSDILEDKGINVVAQGQTKLGNTNKHSTVRSLNGSHQI